VPLDVLVARKLGAPGHPELGIGAIAQGGAYFLNTDLIADLGVTHDYLERIIAAELAEIDRRLGLYRRRRPPLDVRDRTVIIVDDGLATGVTTRAVIRALRTHKPRKIVLAVPVCAPDTAAEIRPEVDDLVCVAMPEQFHAVGAWYRDFAQTSDEEVIGLLAQSEREMAHQFNESRSQSQSVARTSADPHRG